MMTCIKVKELPERYTSADRRNRKDLSNFLNSFMLANAKFAKVFYDERDYSSIQSARSAIQNAIDYYRFPMLAKTINKEIYLIRTDM